MKNIIVIILTAFSSPVFSQIDITDTINHTVLTPYIGVLAGPKVTTKEVKTSQMTFLRFGGSILWTPKKWVSFYGMGAGESDGTGTVTPFSLLGVKFSPSKSISITGGKMASPMTELRPSPTTAGGQFEPWTKAQILGSALGGKVAVKMNDNISIVSGGYWRNTEASAEVGFKVPYTQVAGYYMVKSKVFGGAMSFAYKYFSMTAIYNQRQNVSSLKILEIPYTKKILHLFRSWI